MLHLQALFHTTESLLTFPSKCMGNERAMFYPSADLIFLSLCFLGGSFFFNFISLAGITKKETGQRACCHIPWVCGACVTGTRRKRWYWLWHRVFGFLSSCLGFPTGAMSNVYIIIIDFCLFLLYLTLPHLPYCSMLNVLIS